MPTDNTSPQKQAGLDLPEHKQESISPVVIPETKRKQGKYKSSEEENFTGSESDLPVTQVKMSTTFDLKLKHLLTNYFSATGNQHDTQQTFIQNDILTFDLLINICTLEILKKMKLKKDNNHVDAFTEGKLKLVNDVLLYYNFLYTDVNEI